MDNDSQWYEVVFKPEYNLGHPRIFPPEVSGKLSVAVKFVIPFLNLDSEDEEHVRKLAGNCGYELDNIDIEKFKSRDTNNIHTIVTFSFYLPRTINDSQVIYYKSRDFVERFISLLSFSYGLKLRVKNIQPTLKEKVNFKRILQLVRKLPNKVKIEVAKNIDDITPSDKVFSALFWLRRALSIDREPIETYSNLMVCLQIMARNLTNLPNTTQYCPSCKAKIREDGPTITQRMRELIVSKLGEPAELGERLWQTRNAIVAHGDKPVESEVFIELAKLTPHAIRLAFNSIKLGLGIDLDKEPYPDKSLFVTDAFLNVD
jgi:hypothetical protein